MQIGASLELYILTSVWFCDLNSLCDFLYYLILDMPQSLHQESHRYAELDERCAIVYMYEGQDKTIYETRKSAKIKHRITFIFLNFIEQPLWVYTVTVYPFIFKLLFF